MKNVKAAYHTICTKCSQNSAKSKQLIATVNKERQEAWEKRQELKVREEDTDEKEQGEAVDFESPSSVQPQSTVNVEALKEAGKDEENNEGEQGSEADDEDTEPRVCLRICAMCVSEAALPASDDEADEVNEGPVQRLTLRQRKTLERQQLRQFSKKKKTRNPSDANEDEESEDDDESVQADESPSKRDGTVADSLDDDDEDDPFLKAVGGADKLLTGEAYQKRRLLEQQTQPAIKSS